MSKLKLVELRILDFLSHRDTTLEFRPEHRILVDGASGNGKSAVLESISWALYGEGRVDNRSMIRRGCEKAIVGLTLLDDGDGTRYLIVRSVSSAGKQDLKISRKGVAMAEYEPVPSLGLKGAQEWLENSLLRCSRPLFENSVFYPQDNVESFVRMSAAKRKDMLLEMARSFDFDSLLKRTRELHAAAETELAVEETSLEYLNRRMVEDSAVAVKAEFASKAAKEAEAEVKRMDSLLASMSDEKSACESAKKMYDWAATTHAKAAHDLEVSRMALVSASSDVASKENEVNEVETLLGRKELDGIDERILDLEKKAGDAIRWDAEFKVLDAKIFSLKSDLGTLDSRLEKNLKERDGLSSRQIEFCEALGAPCVKAEAMKEAAVMKLALEIADDTEAIKDKTKEIKSFFEKLESFGRRPEADEGLLESLKKLKSEAEERRSQLKSTNAVLEVSRKLRDKAMEAIGPLNEAVGKAEIELDKAKAELENVRKSAGDLFQLEQDRGIAFTTYSRAVGDLRLAEEAAKALPAHRRDIALAETKKASILTRLTDLDRMKDALGQNGLRALVADLVVPRLEERANDVLARLSDFTLRIDTQKVGAMGGIVEGLFLTVIDPQGNQMDFDSYSGGERLKLVVALSEALAEMQRMDFRLLDELFIGLDLESTDRFAKTLMAIQNRYSQLVCISHLQPIKDLFAEKLVVSKRDGLSSVVS